LKYPRVWGVMFAETTAHNTTYSMVTRSCPDSMPLHTRTTSNRRRGTLPVASAARRPPSSSKRWLSPHHPLRRISSLEDLRRREGSTTKAPLQTSNQDRERAWETMADAIVTRAMPSVWQTTLFLLVAQLKHCRTDGTDLTPSTLL